MADNILGTDGAWTRLSGAGKPSQPTPLVKLRQNDYLGLNAAFMRQAGALRSTHVSIFLSPNKARLGLQFHSGEIGQGALRLSYDGGGGARTTDNRVVRIRAISQICPRLSALRNEHPMMRSWRPVMDASTRLWTIPIIPCFEKSVSDPKTTDSGIYRYRLGQDTVYIGRGVFQERFREHLRSNWQFDRIEVSVLNNEEIERHWESVWISHYRKINGRLPIYNRIAGVALAEEAFEWTELRQSSS